MLGFPSRMCAAGKGPQKIDRDRTRVHPGWSKSNILGASVVLLAAYVSDASYIAHLTSNSGEAHVALPGWS